MKINDIIHEGYAILPPIDRDKYQARDGLEGPIMTRSGKVVYYDNNEGKYYDPDTDMYLTYDEWKAYDPELPIKKEDASADATSSSDIAHVAFPLFGKEKAIRRAVDPKGYLKGKKKPKQPGYPKKVKNIYSTK